MKEYYDRVVIVYIHEEGVYGSVEKMGAYASSVRYLNKNGIEVEEILDNGDFTIVDEIVFEHVEED